MEGFSPNESWLILCSLKVGILFSFLILCMLSDIFFQKKKKDQFYLPWKSAEVGNIPPCKELCLWYSHSPHLDVMQISVGTWTYGNTSFIQSSKIILGLVLIWPSNSQNPVMVSSTDIKLGDRKLWDCSFSLSCVFTLCHFYTLLADYCPSHRQNTFRMLHDSLLHPQNLFF